MLSRLFGSLCTRRTCAQTEEEDMKLVVDDIAKSGVSIRNYAQTHPLYDLYDKDVKDNIEDTAYGLCRGVVDEEYIQSIQDKVPILTVARVAHDVGPVWAAFAQSRLIQHPDGKTELHVDTLCSEDKRGLGGAVLKSVQDFVKTVKKYDMVTVDSIPDAVGFYLKQGFMKVPGAEEKGSEIVKMVKTGGSKFRLKTLRRSHRKEKKYDAIFEMPDGRTKTVPFGQKGYSDFTKHKDTRRRARYIKRHSGMGEDWTDPATPGALSRYILWNKPTVSASLRDFKKRFHV
jgi:hypothetical protein